MSKNRQGGRNHRSRGGSAGGGSNRQGKILYNSGEEPAFIRQFKERTGYKPPATAEDKHRMSVPEHEERPRDGDYRFDDERPQIVQLNPTDLTKEEVDVEIAKAKEAEEERKCVDETGRLLFRKPKEKSEENEANKPAPGAAAAAASITATSSKSEIVDMASTKPTKRKQISSSSSSSSSSSASSKDQGTSKDVKKAKSQLLSFMDETGVDGDD